ncbi:hypothetical protein LTR37_012780 [Vermiconidia calcicola]|uniref:Uncharacterized protein n=1 Tax=Vermiconidia calcicola TaxID=1690605 RepID=A0ACC3MYC4_9PEZI|nr:hypothetical protein LTR37_012780 [Vermiconidia calcicola]
MASTGPLADILAKASSHLSDARPMMAMYIHLILSSLFPIYTGAHASLSRPASAAKPDKKGKEAGDDEDEDEDEDEEKIRKMEGLSNTDAIVLPVTAAITLASLYFLIMRYGASLINAVLGWYFSAIGVYSVTKLVSDALNVLVGFVFPNYYASGGSLWKVTSSEQRSVRQDNRAQTKDVPLPPILNALPLPQVLKAKLWSLRRLSKQKYTVKAYVQTIVDLKVNLTIINLISAIFGFSAIAYVNFVSKPWFLTNLQGFAVSYSAMQIMSPTTFGTGSLILGALFCYDIWAVFFTPLMVTVAKNLDQPIKLVFPRPDEPSATPGEPPVKSFSMLGLGDIVLPGIMIGLALRFDLYLFYLRKQTRTKNPVAESSSQQTTEEMTQKAPYVSVTGHWGDRFWISRLPASSLPPVLRSTFPKPYFTASMIGYVVGMLTTLGVMSVFQHAQPALLYLVPGVLTSIWGTALVRREVKEMWGFSEAVTGEQLKEDDGKDDEGVGANIGEKSPKGLFERLWAEMWAADGETNKEERKTGKDQKKKKSTTGNSPSKADGKKATAKEDNSANDDLVVSFSVSLYNAEAPVTREHDKARSKAEKESDGASSPSSSESSEDAVVVSPRDLDRTQESDDETLDGTNDLTDGTVNDTKKEDESAPRYRTRSSRSGVV